MISGKRIGKVYEEIEKKICNMIPEKWDKIYLYVSIMKGINKLETGEMFFYYYPKSVIKKKPVNVYEVPSRFNLDDEMYLKLADSLYHEIQRLKDFMVKQGEEAWTNLTISIENCQLKVEFDYEDLRKSEFSNIERNLIWQFKYLKKDIGAYRRKERKILEKYIEMEEINPRKVKTHVEPFYIKPETNIVDYNTEYREKLKILAAEEDEKAKIREERKKAKIELARKKKELREKKRVKLKKEELKKKKNKDKIEEVETIKKKVKAKKSTINKDKIKNKDENTIKSKNKKETI